jgi:diaminohydroxyphosphoribosylaminopyrimidine deaminase/5-amino-6-(5-phosphoribosylamino)uracil reductase
VLVESGPKLLGAFIKAGLVDELVTFIAPKLLGSEAIGMVDLANIKTLNEHIALSFDTAALQAGDLVITSKISNFLDTL